MITTIIPYFLLATVPEKTTWINGSEYTFSLKADYNVSHINRSVEYGGTMNMDLTCRLKSEDKLKCLFRFGPREAYEKGYSETRESKIVDEEEVLYEPFLFEISFDTKGVRKLTLNKRMTEDVGVRIAMILANLLNTGMDFKGYPALHGAFLEVNQTNDFLLGECMTSFGFGYEDVKQRSTKKSWNLDINPSLQNLFGRQFEVTKYWNTENCKSLKRFFWVSLIVLNMDLNEEVLIKNTIFGSGMLARRDAFESRIVQQVDMIIQDKYIVLREMTVLTLEDVHPAEGEWEDIADPITIYVNDNEGVNHV